jgi:hypothetical protein
MNARAWKLLCSIVFVAVALVPSRATAQVTPTAGFPPPDDTPSVRVGGTLYVDYTNALDPPITDVNGNLVDPSAFNVGRAYINITGQVNHIIAFRVTPDIVRETGAGSSLNGSLTFRLKYGYGQINLDDWLWRGTYVRAGMIQTPVVDFEEGIYRYRFQGTLMIEREGYLTSSDAGVAFHAQTPNGLAEVYGGYFNGDGYSRVDPNNEKAFQFRGTIRPFPNPGVKRGLRVTFFWDDDQYAQDSDRRRLVTLTSFEHRFLNAGWEYINATDQSSLAMPDVDSSGHSIWVTPRFPHGTVQPGAPAGEVRAAVEGLIRWDRVEPNHDLQSVKDRWIMGVAYWPRVMSASVSAAFLLDYEQVRYHDFAPARPTEKRIAVHAMVTF